MIRLAQPGEEGRLEAFLAEYPDTSMFLRGNLAAHGLVPSEHPHATTFWLSETEAGKVRAVVGCNNDGFMMAQVPEHLPGLWKAMAHALGGRKLAGMTGEDGQVQIALLGLGLSKVEFTLNHDEPLYRLELDTLDVPSATVRTPQAGDEEMLRLWYAEHFIDTGFAPNKNQAMVDARRRASRMTKSDDLRILIENGIPMAMAGINARVADLVQLGSIHVVRSMRNRGLGRKITAALLAEQRSKGARTAVLFANNPAAARAYEAIGFKQVGRYRIAILSRPTAAQVIA